MSVLVEFSHKWCHPEYAATPVELTELIDIEALLQIKFPKDYMEEVLEAGLPSPTLALLSSALEAELALPTVSELNPPLEIVRETKAWHEIGMPKNLVAIGNDCCGNKFCFVLHDLQNGCRPTAPVYFWDHDFDETNLIADSFRDWISMYLGSWADGLDYRNF